MHALGVSWWPAWVLGAAVAPTDATAVGVLARMLPRRNITLLCAALGRAVGADRRQRPVAALRRSIMSTSRQRP